jgi:hypothetical protein
MRWQYLEEAKYDLLIIGVLLGLAAIIGYEIFYYSYPQNLLHYRYGDDLVFHDTLNRQIQLIEKLGFWNWWVSTETLWAYGSIFWIAEIFFAVIFAKVFGSGMVIVAPMIFSLIFLLAGAWVAARIFKSHFQSRSWAITAFLLLMLLPMITSYGMRFHNHSMTFFFAVLTFKLMSELEKITWQKLLLISFLYSILVGIKLSGLMLAPALASLLLTTPGWSDKKNLKWYFLCLAMFLILTPFFICPRFFNVSPYPEMSQSAITEFLSQFGRAVAAEKPDLMENFHRLSQHTFDLRSFIVLFIGYVIWAIKSPRKVRVVGLFVSWLIPVFYLIRTAGPWHAASYSISFIFLTLLGLKGFESLGLDILKSSDKKLRLFVLGISYLFQAALLALSLSHFWQNFYPFHSAHNKNTHEEYRLLANVSEDFLKKHPVPKDGPFNIICMKNSICPWFEEPTRHHFNILYNGLRGSYYEYDYFFLNFNALRGNDYHIFFTEEDRETLRKIINNEYAEYLQLIYESGPFRVYKKIKSPES